MRWKNAKFLVGGGIIVITCGWLAATGFREGMSYYLTADELVRSGETYHHQRLRVAGTVVPGSIRRTVDGVHFVIEQNAIRVPVRYVGTDPLPDTFKDESQAVVEGLYQPQGDFEATFIQAKCASKYEAEYAAPGATTR